MTEKTLKSGYKLQTVSEGGNHFTPHSEKEYSAELGVKYDTDKLRYDLIPPEASASLAKVLTYGASKYGPDNWMKVDDVIPRYYAAMQRHVEAWRSGEHTDPESGLTHLSHAMACLSFLIALEDGVEVPWYDA